MSRMSDIHAAASEIDTTDADAVQALADSLAAERYAADIAAYADAVRRVLENLPPACRECGESLPDYLPGTVKCDECADNVNGSTCPVCECRPGARCDHGCHA